jgi:hypothetical protein
VVAILAAAHFCVPMLSRGARLSTGSPRLSVLGFLEESPVAYSYMYGCCCCCCILLFFEEGE